ncbi:MAG: hypothetical protein RSE33_12255 [Hafnia sp.]
MSTLKIIVSGPTESGKSHVLTTLRKALRETYADLDIQIDDSELAQEERSSSNNLSDWTHPSKGTVFELHEKNEGTLRKFAKPLDQMTEDDIFALFEQYNFRDDLGHKLLGNLDFCMLVKLALTPKPALHTALTVDDLCERPVPIHIQQLMVKLGVLRECYSETCLQPVLDLVNWAIDSPKSTVEAPKQETERQQLASQLIGILSPHCHRYQEHEIVNATVLALFSLITPQIAARELRAIIGNTPER